MAEADQPGTLGFYEGNILFVRFKVPVLLQVPTTIVCFCRWAEFSYSKNELSSTETRDCTQGTHGLCYVIALPKIRLPTKAPISPPISPPRTAPATRPDTGFVSMPFLTPITRLSVSSWAAGGSFGKTWLRSGTFDRVSSRLSVHRFSGDLNVLLSTSIIGHITNGISLGLLLQHKNRTVQIM